MLWNEIAEKKLRGFSRDSRSKCFLWLGWRTGGVAFYICLTKNEAMQRPNHICTQDLRQPKSFRQHFIRERQRYHFLSLSTSFNFCGSPNDVEDKDMLPSNPEFQICLANVNIKTKFWWEKSSASNFTAFVPQFQVRIEPPPLPHLSCPCWNHYFLESIHLGM